MITLENEELKVSVSTQGAEVQSIYDKASRREFLWQGEKAYWSGRCPVLFPIVGGMWNGVYRHEGQEYAIPKHGFARDMVWEATEMAVSGQQTGADFTLDLPDGAAGYPFPCRVTLAYRLTGRRLRVEFCVRNLGSGEMFFQIGGHPGFNLPRWRADVPVGGYLQLEGTEAAEATVLRAGEQGCTGPERYPVPATADGLVPVCVETFNNEALIFDKEQLRGVTLLDSAKQPVVQVKSDAPVWLFWQPQGQYSPFVCAEPWFGLCDPRGFGGNVAERPYINRLPAGGIREGLLWEARLFPASPL